MLFISYEFLVYFLGPVIGLSFCLACLDDRLSFWFIVGASLFFYAHWYWPHLSLLSGSIIINFWLAKKIQTIEGKLKRSTLMFAVMFNLINKRYKVPEDFFDADHMNFAGANFHTELFLDKFWE